ncbi:hypothetical protein ACP275_04G166800 [Erythranthe tilingii]
MKRANFDLFLSFSRQKSTRALIVLGVLYVIFVTFEAPFLLKNGLSSLSQEGSLFTSGNGFSNSNYFVFEHSGDDGDSSLRRPFAAADHQSNPLRQNIKHLVIKSRLSGLNLTAGIANAVSPPEEENGIIQSAKEALALGKKQWRELEMIGRSNNRTTSSSIVINVNGGGGNNTNNYNKSIINNNNNKINNINEHCPHSISITGDEFSGHGKLMVLPCGLTLGSHVTVVGKARGAHVETDPKISDEEYLMVSQFMVELQGLKAVEGEDPPRILHINPRLKGDWSGKPVIEHNSCYRMQWGTAYRCDGRKSPPDDETVDGFVKCEKWIRDDDNASEESNATWWLNRLIGRTKKTATFNWPFPFAEEKLFVLTLNAGLEGYHMNVDGRHIASFPYRTGFTLEDATGFAVNGDIDVISIFAGSLPTSNPSLGLQTHLDLSDRWRAPPIPDGPVELFIGILSAGNHFAERMAVRKSWMQHELIKSSKVVARFFVALHGRKEVNVKVKKEAEFFGDIVVVPYMDNYDLVVLKTVAICEYGVRSVSANYVMKGDDDTFVRVDAIVKEAKKVKKNKSLYIGNINYHHKPLRSGKWAVTYEEWPEEDYPPYANGPGYIISSDIAKFIISDFEKRKLRLFKMEDVSMGMWVEKVNKTRPVEYIHSLKFCQFGCIEDYITAHYQSPRQMLCLWNKLRQQGRPLCCNMR